MSDKCQRCETEPRKMGERYCPACKKIVIQQLRDRTYTEPVRKCTEAGSRRGRGSRLLGGTPAFDDYNTEG